jgi:hypothetical protein
MNNTLRYTLLNNWNIMRIIRVGLSLLILRQAWESQDTVFGLLGTVFFTQGLLNIGCCGSNGCAVDTKANESAILQEDVRLEEIKIENIRDNHNQNR